MDWIKFESPKQLSVAVKYVRNNVYFLENRSAQKLGLYDIKPGEQNVIEHNSKETITTHNK